MPIGTMKLEVLAKDEGHWVGAWGSVLVVFWTNGIVPEACRALAEHVRQVAARERGGKVSVVSVSFPTAPPPSGDARAALAALTLDTADLLHRIAVVREARGFIAAIVVSVVTSIKMLSKPTVPVQSFPDLAAALRWAAGDLGDQLGAQSQVQAMVSAIEREQTRLLSTPPGA